MYLAVAGRRLRPGLHQQSAPAWPSPGGRAAPRRARGRRGWRRGRRARRAASGFRDVADAAPTGFGRPTRICASATSARVRLADRHSERAADRPHVAGVRGRARARPPRAPARDRPAGAPPLARLLPPPGPPADRRPPARVSGKPVFDRAGRFPGYRGTGADITAEVQANPERRARRSPPTRRDRQRQRRLRAVRRARPAGDLQPPLRRDRRRAARARRARNQLAGDPARGHRGAVTTSRPQAAPTPISPSASSIAAAPTARSSSSSSATAAGFRSASTAPRTAAPSAPAPTSPS